MENGRKEVMLREDPETLMPPMLSGTTMLILSQTSPVLGSTLKGSFSVLQELSLKLDLYALGLAPK